MSNIPDFFIPYTTNGIEYNWIIIPINGSTNKDVINNLNDHGREFNGKYIVQYNP